MFLIMGLEGKSACTGHSFCSCGRAHQSWSMGHAPWARYKKPYWMNLLENTEGKAIPQSLTFSTREREKQKVLVISPHFTFKVTPLPQLPPFLKIHLYFLPHAGTLKRWLCCVISVLDAVKTHQESEWKDCWAFCYLLFGFKWLDMSQREPDPAGLEVHPVLAGSLFLIPHLGANRVIARTEVLL